MKHSASVLKEKMREALVSVLPLALVILILCFTVVPLGAGVFLGFLAGCFLLIVGIGLFSLGSEMAMTPMGDYMGAGMAKSKKLIVIILMSFCIGALITISEPDLQVLATYVPSVGTWTLILSVAAGVGTFLVIAMLRVLFGIRLRYLLLVFYLIIFALSFFVPKSFWAIAFDSGGVTTGPMTVPFIMTLGVGISSIRSDRGGKNDSFGFVALCSIGPIMAVLVLGLVFGTQGGEIPDLTPVEFADSREMILAYLRSTPNHPAILDYLLEMVKALAPISVLFFLYQWIHNPVSKERAIRIIVGLLYTLAGLTLFLTGANVGFMPAGYRIGEMLGAKPYAFILIPIGVVIGYFIVAAEPAVQVLEHQVEEVTAGAIPKKALSFALGAGVGISVGIAMLRALTGVSIMYFLAGGYFIALLLTFFTDDVFSSIAFDSGGVASGPMTATFLLALSMGVTTARGGNILTDAFGMVAMVAMTPLISIQILGVIYRIKLRRAQAEPETMEPIVETVIDF